MRVLHVAPLNVAGVPYSMMDMQRRFGVNARLVTLHASHLTFPEDICLDLPLPHNALATWWREHKASASVPAGTENSTAIGHPPVHRPTNLIESLYFRWDDLRRAGRVQNAIESHHLDEFDVIHYDGGLDFFRDSRIARQWKREGKRIVCHYMGSDLRLRGVDSVMNQLSDLNLTNESDHLLLHPQINYLYIPFDATRYQVRTSENPRLRIVHAPTNRRMKGTALILPVMEQVASVRDVEFVLLEDLPHDEVLRSKATCDLAIEQVGNLGGTGYGRNSLETLAMGIPTITEMTSDYLAWLPENPFILANSQTLYSTLLRIIDSRELRTEFGARGRAWVEKYHSYESVNNRLNELYHEHHIF